MALASACGGHAYRLRGGQSLGPTHTVCPVGPPAVRAGERAEPVPAWGTPRVVSREGGRTRFVAGAIRGEFDGDALRWGSGHLARSILEVRRDERGWVFITEGYSARADDFLGPLRFEPRPEPPRPDPSAPPASTPAGVPPEVGVALQGTPGPVPPSWVSLRPPLDNAEFERAVWEAFVRYRLWLSDHLARLRPDGGAIGVNALGRRGPCELWRVDGATGCVTHAPYQPPGGSGPRCVDRSRRFIPWGATLALVSDTGAEVDLYALTDDLRFTSLGPLPLRRAPGDRPLMNLRPGLLLSDDGVHALFTRCHGSNRWCSLDVERRAWRALDGLPSPPELSALHRASLAYYDRAHDRVRVRRLDGGDEIDLGAPPFQIGPQRQSAGEPWLEWRADGALLATGRPRAAVPAAQDDPPDLDEARPTRSTWIARAAAPPFVPVAPVRTPYGCEPALMLDASRGLTLRVDPLGADRVDLLRTRDAGAHWEVVEARADAWVPNPHVVVADPAPLRAWLSCDGPFCVAMDRLLLARDTPEPPGEDVLGEPAPPPSLPLPLEPEVPRAAPVTPPPEDPWPDGAMVFLSEEPQPPRWTPEACRDPVEVIEALDAARRALDVCLGEGRAEGELYVFFDERGRLVVEPPDPRLAQAPRCSAALARILPRPMPAANCAAHVRLLPDRVVRGE